MNFLHFTKKETVSLGNFVYTLYRSNRKTIGIQLKRTGEVVVRAPFFSSSSEINDVLLKNIDWILSKQAELFRAMSDLGGPEDHYFDGALFPFGSGHLTLRLQEDSAARNYTILLRNGETGPELVLRGASLSPETCRKLVSKWGRRYAGDILRERVRQWAEVIGVSYNNVTIKETKSRWGSCSAEGNINLHWKLLMLPERLRDYVIVHELCHRFEMNHSTAFWDTVARFLPDYDSLRKELRDREFTVLNW